MPDNPALSLPTKESTDMAAALLLNLALLATIWYIYGMGAGLLSTLLSISVALSVAVAVDQGNEDLEYIRREAGIE